jgi:hypothetical protein
MRRVQTPSSIRLHQVPSLLMGLPGWIVSTCWGMVKALTPSSSPWFDADNLRWQEFSLGKLIWASRTSSIQIFWTAAKVPWTNLRPNRSPRNCGCLALALADVEQNLDMLKSKDTFIVGSDTSYMILPRMYFTSPSHKVPNDRAPSNLNPPACPSPFITPHNSTAALPSRWSHVTAWRLHHVSMLLSISDTIKHRSRCLSLSRISVVCFSPQWITHPS